MMRGKMLKLIVKYSMLSVYNFNYILELMNEKYQSFYNTERSVPNGLRYFAKLEPLIGLSSLEDKPKHLAYLSKN